MMVTGDIKDGRYSTSDGLAYANRDTKYVSLCNPLFYQQSFGDPQTKYPTWRNRQKKTPSNYVTTAHLMLHEFVHLHVQNHGNNFPA